MGPSYPWTLSGVLGKKMSLSFIAVAKLANICWELLASILPSSKAHLRMWPVPAGLRDGEGLV